MGERYLEAGRIVKAHGVRGELVMEPWADSPEFLLKAKELWFDRGRTSVGLVSARVHKGRLLLKLHGVDTPEQAEALRGKVLYLDREQVSPPEGAVYLRDLLGLRAIDGNTGREYGRLTEVLEGVANDVYRIVDKEGHEYLFPAVKHMVKRVAPEEGVIELLPIPGIFDGDSEEA